MKNLPLGLINGLLAVAIADIPMRATKTKKSLKFILEK